MKARILTCIVYALVDGELHAYAVARARGAYSVTAVVSVRTGQLVESGLDALGFEAAEEAEHLLAIELETQLYIEECRRVREGRERAEGGAVRAFAPLFEDAAAAAQSVGSVPEGGSRG